MTIDQRKRLLAAALLVTWEDGRENGLSSGLDPLPLAFVALEARWARIRKRSVKSYWLGEAARVLAVIEVSART